MALAVGVDDFCVPSIPGIRPDLDLLKALRRRAEDTRQALAASVSPRATAAQPEPPSEPAASPLPVPCAFRDHPPAWRRRLAEAYLRSSPARLGRLLDLRV